MQIKTRAWPAHITIGDEIRLFVQIERPRNISIKPFSPKTPLAPFEIKNVEAVPATRAVLGRHAGKRRLLVTSFRHDVATAIAAQLAVDCGLLLAHRPLDVGAIIAGCAAWPRIKAVIWDYNVVDESVLRAVTAGGWRNYVYGAVTYAEHQHCAGLGLAGLITDYPDHVPGRPGV